MYWEPIYYDISLNGNGICYSTPGISGSIECHTFKLTTCEIEKDELESFNSQIRLQLFF